MRRRLEWAYAAIIILSASISAQAAFDDNGAGARATGMANAFVGLADDVNALYYNPSGLSQLRQKEVTTQFGRLGLGLDDGSELGSTYLGYAHPLAGNRGTLAFGYDALKLTSLYLERTLSLSYGWTPRWQPFADRGTWMAGATLKHLHREFVPNEYTGNALNDAGFGSDQQDPVFAANGNSSDALGLDLGALYRFGGRNAYSLGLTLLNVNRPDVSLAGDGDAPPFGVKIGFGYRAPWGVATAETRRIKRLDSATDSETALGVERRFSFGDWGAIEARGGYAAGSRGYKAATLGLGYAFGNAQFDYSFNIPIANLSDTEGSHRVGFSVRWGDENANEDENEPKKDDAATAAEPPPTPGVVEQSGPVLPDAPVALTAPEPVVASTPTIRAATETEVRLAAFREALGHYFMRKEEGASLDERRQLLERLIADHADVPVDMSVVDDELAIVNDAVAIEREKAKRRRLAEEEAKRQADEAAGRAAEARRLAKEEAAQRAVEKKKAEAEAARRPTTERPKKAVKPAPVTVPTESTPSVQRESDPAFRRSWLYYRESSNRGLSDTERLELLLRIRAKVGSGPNGEIDREIERIRRRLPN